MASNKGFSMIEIITVLIIVGILAAFTIPVFVSTVEQTKAQTAKNNLMAIAAAQQKYYEDQNPNAYCTAACTTTATINSNLKLGISDPVNYACAAAGANYTCTWNDGTDALTLAVNAAGTGVTVTCLPGGCGLS